MIQNAKRYMEKIMINHDMDNSDTFLGYLPCSHIMEMLCDVKNVSKLFSYQKKLPLIVAPL